MLSAACNVSVQVKDVSGAVVGNASVAVTSDGQIMHRGQTDTRGECQLVLREGSYTLSVASPGFPSAKQLVTLTDCPEDSMERIPVVLGMGMIIDWVWVSADFSVPLEAAPVPNELQFHPTKHRPLERLGRKLKSLLVRPKTG